MKDKNNKRMCMAVLVIVLAVVCTGANAALVAHYKMDETQGDPNDATGNYDAVFVNYAPVGPDWRPTESKDPVELGGSLYLRGISTLDRVDCGDVPISSTTATIAYWIKSNGLAHTNLMSKWANNTSGSGFEVKLRANGSLRFYVGSGGAHAYVITETMAGICYADNTWVHHAFVYDNGTVTFYVDGLYRAQGTTTRHMDSPGTSLFLGASYDVTPSAAYYRGHLDDVRIYDHALTPTEIRALPGMPENLPPTIAPIEGIIVAPNIEGQLFADILDDDAQGFPLSVSWEVIDQPVGSTVTFGDATAADTTVTVSDEGKYVLRVVADDTEFVAEKTALILCRSDSGVLRNHYAFENDSNDSVSGENGQALGTPVYVAGVPALGGMAMHFDGTDAQILDCGPWAATTDGSFSFSGWFNADFIANANPLHKQSGISAFRGIRVMTRADGSFRWVVGGSTPVDIRSAAGMYAVDEWVHLAGTADMVNDTMVLYINGFPVGSRSLAGRNPNVLETDVSLLVGSRFDRAERFRGQIDDLRFYDKALSYAEVRALTFMGGINLPPYVDAGPIQETIYLPQDSLLLQGIVIDEDILTIVWTQESGPGTVTFGDDSQSETTATFSTVGNYVLKLTATDEAQHTVSDQIFVKVRPADWNGLVAHMSFDNDLDSFENGIAYTGVNELGSAVVGTDGLVGPGAVSFNGADAVSYSQFLISDPELTVMLWVKFNSVSDDGGWILDKNFANAEEYGKGVSLRLRTSAVDGVGRNISAIIGTSLTDAIDLRGPIDTVDPNEWVHVALTFERNDTGTKLAKLYQDGILVQQRMFTSFYDVDGITEPLRLGARHLSDPDWRNFLTGSIDDLYIFDYALTTAEIQNYITGVGQTVWPDPCTYTLVGDWYQDCKVDIKDFAILAELWLADLGTSLSDLADLAMNWLNTNTLDLAVVPGEMTLP